MMHKKYTMISFLAVAMLLPGTAQSMTISDFVKLDDQSAVNYTKFLIMQTMYDFNDQGKQDQVAAMQKLFIPVPGQQSVEGSTLLFHNIALYQSIEQKKPGTSHTVEQAYYQTLKHFGIDYSQEKIEKIASRYVPRKQSGLEHGN